MIFPPSTKKSIISPKISPPAKKRAEKSDHLRCKSVLSKNKKSEKSEKDRLRNRIYKFQYTFYIGMYTTIKAHKKYTRIIN